MIRGRLSFTFTISRVHQSRTGQGGTHDFATHEAERGTLGECPTLETARALGQLGIKLGIVLRQTREQGRG